MPPAIPSFAAPPPTITQVSNLYTIPLQPGRNTFKNPGRHWTLVECPVELGVKLGVMPDLKLIAGQGVSFDAPDQFDRYELTNPLATVLVVKFWCGFVRFVNDNRNQYEAPTTFVPAVASGGYAPGALAANSFIELNGSVGAGRVRRKAVQVFNLDPASNLLLADAAGNVGGIVRPGETITQPVSGPIRVQNVTGAAIACWISEIWWTP